MFLISSRSRDIAQSRELWAEVMTIETDISPEVEDALEKDSFAKEALIEVMRECMINAVRHGQASSFSISTKLQTSEAGTFASLLIKNNGQKLPEALEPGFGSELFNDATSSWTRENWDEGVVVNVLIPVTG
jgi:two-component sensor histidine kinase